MNRTCIIISAISPEADN